MTESKSTSMRWIRPVMRASGLVLLLLIVVLETVGFPRGVTDAVTRRLSRSDYVVEAEGMRMDLLTGLYFSDVRIFRKKVVGPPAVECEGMRVRWSPSGKTGSTGAALRIELIDGRVLPAQAAGEAGKGGESAVSTVMLTLTDMVLDGIPVKRMSCDVSTAPAGFAVSNILCSVGGEFGDGKASGWVSAGHSGDVSGRLVTELDPNLLLPMLERIKWNYTSDLIRRFKWGDSKPIVDTTFTMTGLLPDREFRSQSVFAMKDYSYRSVSNDNCNGLLSVSYGRTGEVVSVDHISIGIADGVIVGGFAYDDRRKALEYRAVTDVDPRDFFQMVGLFTREEMQIWSFPGKTRFISQGTIDFASDDGDSTRVLAEVESSGIGLGPLKADSCRFNVNMLASTCRLTNVQGTMWDGTFEAHSEIVLQGEGDVVTFGCQFDKCDFSKVAAAVSSNTTDMSGKFYVAMDGSFILSSNALDTLTARGRMSVDAGRVFQLPVFGGLTKIMSKIIPGLDFVIAQSDMSSEFTVGDRVVSSDKISIEGGLLSLSAKGSSTFDGELDYAIQVKLMSEHSVVAKLIRAVTWPISKLMEFRLKGTREDPTWYPINFSSELLDRIGLRKSVPSADADGGGS